jgi:hypothetical protein
MSRRCFTVIGFYEGTGLTFAHHVKADGPHEAISEAVAHHLDMSCPSDVAVIGAVPGHVQLTPSCDESGNLAYACDLRVEEICECGRDPSECATLDGAAEQHSDRRP